MPDRPFETVGCDFCKIVGCGGIVRDGKCCKCGFIGLDLAGKEDFSPCEKEKGCVTTE